ncbi:MAG: ABC transporter permease subunit [Candidatus Caldarchaeum sp.]
MTRLASKLKLLVEYELRRSLARKRIIMLLTATLLLQVGIYLVFTRLPTSLVSPITPYTWMIGVLAPSTALIHILALTIGASTSAEEYEVGTADYWFTRPLARHEYFLGKILGGFVLISLLITTYSLLALALSSYVFGPQSRLEVFALAVAASVASSLPFYSMGLAVGEMVRRSMVSTIITGTVFFASFLTESYASIAAVLGGDRSLLEAVKLLPTWGSVGLTSTIVLDNLSLPTAALLNLFNRITPQDIPTALLNLFAYTAAATTLAWLKFRYSDVSRRAS